MRFIGHWLKMFLKQYEDCVNQNKIIVVVVITRNGGLLKDFSRICCMFKRRNYNYAGIQLFVDIAVDIVTWLTSISVSIADKIHEILNEGCLNY